MYDLLNKIPLFRGLTENEIRELLSPQNTRKRIFEKGETVLYEGEPVRETGIVLSGKVIIELSDAWGNNSVISGVEKGGAFAEAYACVPGSLMLQHVTAYEKSEILFIDIRALLETDGVKNKAQLKLLKNLLTVCASKNLKLSSRMLNITPKTIRARLMSYFSECVKTSGSYKFEIPYDRRQLADYLGVDRSALSAELSKMRKDGLIEYNKNRFKILVNPSEL